MLKKYLLYRTGKMRINKQFLKKLLNDKLSLEERKNLSKDELISNNLLKQWNEISGECNDEKAEKRIWSGIVAKCWGEQYKMITPKTSFLRMWRVAASIAILVIALTSYWLIQKDSESYITAFVPKGQIQTIILPDSSIIWLNSETTIKYPKKFAKNREIQLEGEAFFDVKHLENKPFRIYFLDALVEVKGTTFNVKSYPDTPVEISLITGKIDFCIQHSQNAISMKPSEQVIYNAKNRKFEHKQIPKNNYDWRKGVYKFSDKPLDELLNDINRIYDVNIIINDKYKDDTFSGTVRKDEPVLDVIEKLCINLGLNYRFENQKIVLYK